MSIKYLVKKGKPCFEFCIVGEHKVIDNAVEDITSAIEKISGAKFETQKITAERILTVKNKVVFTTFDSCKQLKQIFPDEYNFLYGSDGFTVKEYKDNVFIVSHMPRGVYYGAFDLLEKNCDVLWTRAKPGEEISYIPSEDIVLSAVDYSEKSPFKFRGWNLCGSGVNDSYKDLNTVKYYSRNKNNTKMERYGEDFEEYGISEFGKGIPFIHNFSEYYESDPDLFMKDPDGLPRKNQGSFSFINYYNYKAAQIVADKIIFMMESDQSLIEKEIYIGIPDDDYFNMEVNGENLSSLPFTADNGKTVYPDEENYKSTVFFNFLNRIIAIVKEKYPSTRFCTLAYLYCTNCPEVDINEDLAVAICPINKNCHNSYEEDTSPYSLFMQKTIGKWREKTDKVFIYTYWQSMSGGNFYPRPMAKVVQKEMQYYLKVGVNKLLPEGVVDFVDKNGKYDRYDMNEPYIWLMNKLMWNPYADLDELMRKYCRIVFGKAALYMYNFYSLIQNGWDSTDTFVFCATGADVYIKQFIIKAGITDEILDCLSKALSEYIGEAPKRRISNVYDILKTQIDRYKRIKDENMEATFCGFGKDYILSDSSMDIENNKDSVWNRTGQLKEFKDYNTVADYDEKAKLNIRILYDKEYVYIGFQIFDDMLSDKEIYYNEGVPVAFRSDGTQISSYTETYIGASILNMSEYFGYITGVFSKPKDQAFFICKDNPEKIVRPENFEEKFFFYYDEKPDKRYYFHVQAISYKDLGTRFSDARPFGSFVYYNDRYGRTGWKGNGLWAKQGFEEIKLLDKNI